MYKPYTRVKSSLEVIEVVQCNGEAHHNAYIDHCMVCLPYWETYPICKKCGYKVAPKPYGYFCFSCRIMFRGKVER